MSTLRTGICLLFLSSVGVMARMARLALTTDPLFKWICVAGLGGSLLCFVSIYLRSEAPTLHKTLALGPNMIRSPLWKSSSTA